MFTQTHLLLGAAIYAKPKHRAVTIAGLAGALLPDTDVWLMFVVERMRGASGCEVFHYRYWEQPWTTLQMVLNSTPAYLALIVVGFACISIPYRWPCVFAVLLLAFSSSALLHVAIDFLLHHDDARAQWMPFTDWVFRSPVSYWDPAHNGAVFMPLEIGLGLALAVLVGRRFRGRRMWAVLAVLCLGYGATITAGLKSGGDHPRGRGSCDVRAKTDV